MAKVTTTLTLTSVIHQVHPLTMHSVLRRWAGRTPKAPAMAAPGRTDLCYKELWALVERSANIISGLGVTRGDVVIISLPQGAEMAVAFLAVCSVALGAPLRFGSNREDFEFACDSLNPKAILVQAGTTGAAQETAQSCGIPLIEITPVTEAPAGVFNFVGIQHNPISLVDFSEPDDFAIVLSTSGTTSRPKMVPITHRKWCAASENTTVALSLTQRDRCLNVMPLFHAHGLGVGVLSSFLAGGTVMCTPMFDASKFFEWMEEFRPTWFSAVPTMHQALLTEAVSHNELIRKTPLRFIRSASSLLNLKTMKELEQVFQVPVTEGYGLTEAPQLTNTPIEITKRKLGSLGVAGSSEIAAMGKGGQVLGPNEFGEIVCRGPVVFSGYLNNPEANRDCFQNGWFRTGDLGYVDADGHLYMTGRLKDIINRGGEKVSPQEVDQALMDLAPVANAVTFGFPNPALGEDVAAVVTLRPGMSATAGEIRELVAARLSDFKVPRRVLIVSSIPAGPTGKLVRREVAQRFVPLLGEKEKRAKVLVKPRDPLEYQIINIWEGILGFRPMGITDDFFDHGGDSLLAARMMVEIERVCGKTIHPSILFSAPTVELLTRHMREQPDPNPLNRPLIEVQRGGKRRPFIFLNGDYNGGGFYCRNLARLIGPQQPFYTLSPHGIEGDGAPKTVEENASVYLDVLRAMQPSGPYLLGGFSQAGLIAYEMARQLEEQGERTALLVVLDMAAPNPRLRHLRSVINGLWRLRGLGAEEQKAAFLLWRWRLVLLRALFRKGLVPWLSFCLKKVVAKTIWDKADASDSKSMGTGGPDDERLERISRAYAQMIEQYVPRPYGGCVTLVSSAEGPITLTNDLTLGWRKVASEVEVIPVPGNHMTCITTHVEILAECLQPYIEGAQA